MGPDSDDLTQVQRLEFAWRAHEANVAWVRGVDQKASIVLVVAVALATVFANEAFATSGALAHVSGLRLLVTVFAGVLLGAAVLLALVVVRPTLKARETKRNANSGVIYFGHLRHRTATEIARALGALDASAALGDLSRQLADLGDLGWQKHRRLQRSLEALLAGAALFVVARFLI